MRKRKKKRNRYNIEEYAAWLWCTTIIYILGTMVLGAVAVVFLLFDALTIGNAFAQLTRATFYAFVATGILSVAITAYYVVTEEKKGKGKDDK